MESFGKVLKSMKLADLRELRENAAFLVSRVPSDVCAGYFEETRYTYSVKKAPKTRGSPRISVELADIKKNKANLSLRTTSPRPFLVLVSATAMHVTTYSIEVLWPASATSHKIDQRDTLIVLYPIPCTVDQLLSILESKLSAATAPTQDLVEVEQSEPSTRVVPAASGPNGSRIRQLCFPASLKWRMILMLCAACFLQQTLYPYVSFVVECASSLLAMFARQSMTVFLTLLKLMRPSVLLKSFLGAVIMLPTVPVTKKALRDHRKADVCSGMGVQPADDIFLEDSDGEDRVELNRQDLPTISYAPIVDDNDVNMARFSLEEEADE